MAAKRKGRPPKRVDAEKLIQRAVQVASKDTTQGRKDLSERPDLVKSDELSQSVNSFLHARTGMLAKEFYERVTAKLEGLVDDLADDLVKRHKDMPAQNLAYALGVVLDKVNALKGRPQAFTANLSVGFGPNKRSREEILAFLSGESEEKVVEEVEKCLWRGRH